MTESVNKSRWDDPETVRILLENRARALARPPVEAAKADTVAVLEVLVARERYGIEAQSVEYVDTLPSVTPLPTAPSPWAGLVNLRGSLRPVIDLRSRLGLGDGAAPENRALIVVAATGGQVALIADEITGINQVAPESIGPPLASDAVAGSIALGVTDDLLTLIDIEELIAPAGSTAPAGGGSKE
ncbi:MAG: chemotaxis protein CheW [Actinobacteria bacterium]|nr:chemotaxis protein CheW [Actinomycetota bacterium]